MGHSEDAIGTSDPVRKTTGFFTNSRGIKIVLESYLRAKGVWERNWMNLEMQTTLLNTYPPKLIATILKALREQLKEIDPLTAAGQTTEIPLDDGQIWKRRILG